MLTTRRTGLALALIVVAAVGWSAWLAVRTAQDLQQAQASVQRIQAALEAADASQRDDAIADLQSSAASAKDHTDGWWWGAMGFVPFVGDDVGGIERLSASLDLVASEAVDPLRAVADQLDSVMVDGRFDVDALTDIQAQVGAASLATTKATGWVTSEDAAGFAGPLRSRYETYVETLTELSRSLGSADTATTLLPTMLGGSGPRQYLLIFENNAEIRATGGLPGSWALVNADDGALTIARQGSADAFDIATPPVGDLTREERVLFGPEMGRFFQDPNFTPDFPRAAEVFDAFWLKQFPEDPIDGVISIDVVGLSYLMNGIGSLPVGDLTLTADNLVDALLSTVYADSDPTRQDATFQAVVTGAFDAVMDGETDPVALVRGVARASREGRLKVAPFADDERAELAGTVVAGALSGDDGATPHLDIALNDATASKMSYYLRYDSVAQARSCLGGRQQVGVTLSLSQDINFVVAKNLPDLVTGYGFAGVQPGEQRVRVHLFAPFGGTISDVQIDGEPVMLPEVVAVGGRPAVTLSVLVGGPGEVVVTFELETGPGQIDAGVTTTTPSVVPGMNNATFASACS